MQYILDRIMLDPVTDAAAKQDCPNNDREKPHPLTVYNTSSSACNIINTGVILSCAVLIQCTWEQRTACMIQCTLYLPALDKAS